MEKLLRRSQLIYTWGVGNIINFPGNESLMTCGLDVWNSSSKKCPENILLKEERLEKRLKVDHFRQPSPSSEIPTPAVRFPLWHYCPWCGGMDKLALYSELGRCSASFTNGRNCSEKKYKNKLIPSRFISVCEAGHIEDFPFGEWAHKESGCFYEPSTCRLRIKTGASSTLAGIIIECVTCNVSQSMAKAFNKDALKEQLNIDCSAARPWLGELKGVAKCSNSLHVVQRGASNVHFPKIINSIYLPKWGRDLDSRIVDILDDPISWDVLTSSVGLDGKPIYDSVQVLARIMRVNTDDLYNALLERINCSEKEEAPQTEESYRYMEYKAMLSGLGGDNQDFSVTKKNASEYAFPLSNYFDDICLVHKLKVTSAYTGFSRWLPDTRQDLDAQKKNLYKNEKINWLPAIAIRGEGIFITFNEEKLTNWSRKKSVKERVERLACNYHAAELKRDPDKVSLEMINERLILLHTFAHLLINQLAYSCGYGSASLQERIYCDVETTESMNGMLIYTASGDSEGSLGGLVRQGKPGFLEEVILAVLSNAQWCSSDPICINSNGQGPDSCNLAACHCCSLLPETCCEKGNRLLDRAVISGTIENPEIGFFSEYYTDQV